MKAFLKDNIALVAAIVLPLLLALVFGISTLIMNVTVEDPKNDFLIVTNFDNYNNRFEFTVQNDKLNVSLKAAQKDGSGNPITYPGNPHLWRIHVPEMSAEEISLRIPNTSNAMASIDVPGISDLKIKNISPGPDGYTFTNSYRGGGNNLMTEIFSGGNYYDRYTIALFKNGRYVTIKVPETNSYNYYNTQFIGWIIEE